MSVKTKTRETSIGALTLLKIFKGMLVSLITTFVGIIVFAFVIKWAGLSDEIITPVNLGIKTISVMFGIFVVNKNSGKKLINGIIFAILYTLISFIIFSLLNGNLILGLGIIADFGFNIVIGIISSLLSAIGKNN